MRIRGVGDRQMGSMQRQKKTGSIEVKDEKRDRKNREARWWCNPHCGRYVGLPFVTTRDTTMLLQKLYGGAFHSGHQVTVPEVTTTWHHHVDSEAR